jgi:hypothetical protein
MRKAAFLGAVAAIVVLPATALAMSYAKVPPSGTYKFYTDPSTSGTGALTVSGKTVSDISFALLVGQVYQSSSCVVPAASMPNSTVEVSVSGSFKLVRQKEPVKRDYRYWVVGGQRPSAATDIGVTPVPATFTVAGQAPISGEIGVFFENVGNGIEHGTFYASFGNCLSDGGVFTHKG